MFFGGFEDFLGGGGGGPPRRPKGPVDNKKYYDVLGVTKDADTAEIRKSYRNLSKTAHPDKGGDPEKFKDLVKAYETLSDPDKRAKYDEFGEEAEQMGDHPFHGRQRKNKADNIQYPLLVTLEDVYKGLQKKLRISKNIICSGCAGAGGKKKESCAGCRGRGFVVQLRQIGPGMIQQAQAQCGKCDGRGTFIKKEDRCSRCDGAGTTKEAKVFEINIERGMKDDDRIVQSGEGEQEPDSDPGDLVVIVKVQKHSQFHRQGNHLFLKQSIPLVDALTGFETKIIHLDGHVVLLKSKPGSVIKPGQFKAIRNEGMPYRNNPFKKGTLYVEFEVEFPKSIDSKQIELLRTVFGKKSQPQSPMTPASPVAVPGGAAAAAASKNKNKKKKKKGGSEVPEAAGPAGHGVPAAAAAAAAAAGDGKMEEEIEEVEMEDVDLETEKQMWRKERDEERERQAAEEEEEGGHGGHRAACSTQ